MFTSEETEKPESVQPAGPAVPRQQEQAPPSKKKHSTRFRLHQFPPIQLLLYLILRIVVMVLDMFPYERAARIGRLLGAGIRKVDRKHTRVAEQNLRKTRGVCPPEEIPDFLRRVYANIGTGLVEMFMTRQVLRRRRLAALTRLERFDPALKILAGGRGLIVAIGHLGNWELIGLAVNAAGIPLHSLARPIENPWIERWLTSFRTQTGQILISKHGALAHMIQVLKRKQSLIVQIDQNVRNGGVLVDFFGRPATAQRSPAVLSLKYGVPIIVADIYREGGIHHCRLSDPLEPEDFASLPDPVQAMTQAYTTMFEACVRAHPDQWLWPHNRWRSGELAVSETVSASRPAEGGPSR